MLPDLMLQAEVLCSRLEAGAHDLPDSGGKSELRQKISECRGCLSQLQELYEDDRLTLDQAVVAATFRYMILCLMWVVFRARHQIDYKLFRKFVVIESSFTYLLISHRESKL